MSEMSKAYWVPWYPKDALIDFCELTAEEIGVYMQIINLIYHRQRPVLNDPASIGKKCNIQKAKCKRIIHTLINKDCLHLNNEGLIVQKRCLVEIENIKRMRETKSKNGQKGAKKRWQSEQNQTDRNDGVIFDGIANTKTINTIEEKTNTLPVGSAYQGSKNSDFSYQSFNIDHHLTDDGREHARAKAPGWDQQTLMKKYNKWIQEEKKEVPIKPDAGYPAWCRSYTKGKPPQ